MGAAMNDYTKQPDLPKGAEWKDVETYFYEDLSGEHVLKITRQVAVFGKDPVVGPSGKQRKQFPQFWIKYRGPKPKGQRGLLYHVKKIRAAVKLQKIIFLVEGEACADLLRKWGFEATCNDGGAGKWTFDHAEELYGAIVIIMPDNDDRGRAHADDIGRSLINGFAQTVHLLEMPPEYGDVKNWIEDGHTKEQFEELLKTATRDWKPYGPQPQPKELIQSIEIRPGEVELFNVAVEGGTIIVDAEALNWFPKFNRAAIAQIRRSFPQHTNKAWSTEVDRALRSAKEPVPVTEEQIRYHGTDTWTDEPMPWLVRERIPAQGVGLLSGQFSTFKSFVLLDLFGSVMTGSFFLNAPTIRRGGVLLFAAEGAFDIPMRLKALIEHRLAKETTDPDLFKPGQQTRLPFSYIPRCRPLLNPQTVDWMVAKAREAQDYFQKEFGFDLVLIGIDTMSAAAGWDNENDAAQVQIVMNHLADVSKATGAFVLAVDHFGKDISAGTRGSVVKEASADVIFATLGERDEEANAVLDLRLKVRKERSAPEGVQYPFEARTVDMGHDADYLPLTSRVINWNVVRVKREKPKKKTLAETVLVETIAQANRTRLAVNGVQVEAMREEELQDAYREVYRQYKPDAGSDAIGEARRRALRDMQEKGEIAHGTVEGVVYWWFPPSGPF
jgi:hypothetical protein